jgi:hypothetical protein
MKRKYLEEINFPYFTNNLVHTIYTTKQFKELITAVYLAKVFSYQTVLKYFDARYLNISRDWYHLLRFRVHYDVLMTIHMTRGI